MKHGTVGGSRPWNVCGFLRPCWVVGDKGNALRVWVFTAFHGLIPVGGCKKAGTSPAGWVGEVSLACTTG